MSAGVCISSIRVREKKAHRRDDRRRNRSQIAGICDGAAHLRFISGAEFLRDQNGVPVRQPRDEAEHEKVHGTGRARRGQRLHADAAPEHDRIGDRIKLLENIGEQQRRRKRQKQPHRGLPFVISLTIPIPVSPPRRRLTRRAGGGR